MKHATPLLIKYVIIAIILEVFLGTITDLGFAEILFISAAVTIIAYIIGDLLVLLAFNNITATLVDIGLALFTIYMSNLFLNNKHIFVTDSLIAAVLVGVGEWFFHKYVVYKVFPDSIEE